MARIAGTVLPTIAPRDDAYLESVLVHQGTSRVSRTGIRTTFGHDSRTKLIHIVQVFGQPGSIGSAIFNVLDRPVVQLGGLSVGIFAGLAHTQDGQRLSVDRILHVRVDFHQSRSVHGLGQPQDDKVKGVLARPTEFRVAVGGIGRELDSRSFVAVAPDKDGFLEGLSYGKAMPRTA